MNYNSLNAYIYNYLTNDKTNSAIMLTGAWGTGKSYYVINELIPFIAEKGEDCLLLSLYGINTLDELSRDLCWAARISKIKNKNALDAFCDKRNIDQNTVKKYSSAVVKLIAKGAISHYGISISEKDKDLLNIYKLIGNIKGKFIILEDIERTDIDILQLLGFINSLVEQDNVKVLLVANEDEIIHKQHIDENDGHLNTRHSSNEINYLMVKEKTISDTIQFECNYKQSIRGIIDFFKYEGLSDLCGNDEVDDILDIMILLNEYNLRSLMYACQKTIDIYKKIKFNASDDFYRCIFYSITAFSLRSKSGVDSEWKYAENFSYELGISSFPLFKFCYEYLKFHEFDVCDIQKSYHDYLKLCLYDKNKSQNDSDFRIITDFYCEYEKDVISAVNSITEKLKDINIISFYDYGRLGANLIMIKHKLSVDVSQALGQMINNLKSRSNDIIADDIFQYSLRYEEDPIIRKEYYDFEINIRKALKKSSLFDGFSYRPNQSEMLFDYVKNNEISFHGKEMFSALLDVPKLITMFSESSPREMNNIRKSFMHIYRVDNIKAFLAGDLVYLEDIKSGINNYLKSNNGDRNQKYQANCFVQELTTYIDKIK